MKYIKNFILFTLIICSGLFFVACNDSNKNDTTPRGYEVSLETAYAVAQDKGYVGTYDEFIEAIKGESGADGKGILSIEKYSANGLVDTYKITYTDETTSLFTITNGNDGNGISAINKVSSSIIDGRNQTKYTILYTNGSSFDFFVADGKNGESGVDGKGIKTIAKTSTSGLVDTYTILFTDDSKTIFSVTNGKDGIDGKDGRGIKVIAKTSTSGLVDTYTITYTDDTITYFNVTNGKDGVDGNDGCGITNITTTENKENNSTTINITYGDNEKTVSLDVYNGKDGENGKDGRGIKVIAKTSTSGLVDTYTITYTDNTESTFTVTNGVGVKNAIVNNEGHLIIQLTDDKIIDAGNVMVVNGVKSIEKTSTNGLEVVYTITYDNGDTTTFTITNGKDGEDGRGIEEIQKDSIGFTDSYTIKYTDGTTYSFTVTNGQNGLSAYEIYKIYFPEYTKTEYEWILDLVNGELATKQEETLTVTFDSNGGSAVESQTGIKYAGKATKPANPTRTGYEFDGWFYQDEKWSFIGYSVTENITLTAKWIAIKYKISFNTNGYPEEYDDIELTFEDDLVLPEPIINGHTYVWQINGESVTNGRWSIASDTTIDLVLTAIDYKINYVLNGGTNSSNNLYGYTVEDEIIPLYDATLKHHNFIGWYENALFEGEKTTVIDTLRAEDVTLYACFEEKQYAITVDSDGGSVENYTLTIYAGDEYLIETPTKEHFVFDKWIGYTNEEKTEFITIEQSGIWDYDNVVYIKALYSAMFETNGSAVTAVTEYYTSDELVIPNQIDGVEITEIGKRAFENNSQFTSIVIPDTITIIRQSAFNDCINVKTLTIGENVELIENYAFADLCALEVLNYNAKSVMDFTDYYYIDQIRFLNGVFFELGCNSSGTIVNFGSEVKKIPSWLFYAPESLPNVTQINYAEDCKIEQIGDGAFLGLTSLKSITIPKSVKQIGYRAFSDLWGLEEIIFNSEELVYVLPENSSDYGDLREVFAGAGNTNGHSVSGYVKFIFGADVKTLTDNHVSMFDNSGYGSPTYIKTIDFSQNNLITELPENLFEQLYWIDNIILSESITTIQENVFYSESETKHLENIYYMGTPEQFEEILVLNENGGNKYFGEADVYYFAEPDDDISNGYINYWFFDENGEIVTWTPEKYTITYYTNGGSLSGSQKTIYTEVDEDYTFEIPTKTGYEFAGWFITNEFEDEITGITKGTSGNFPIYAKWELVAYTITYITYDNTVDNLANKTSFTIETETFNILDISRTGYNFLGWYDSENFEYANKIKQITKGTYGNTSLYAKWDAVDYLITYNTDGGVMSGMQKTTYTIEDGSYLLEIPKKIGYQFLGWFDSNDFENAEEIAFITKGSTGDVEVFAKWNMLNYTYSIETVTFDKYGNEDTVNVGGIIHSYSINNTSGDVFATENTFNADYSSMKLKLSPNMNYIFAGVYVNGVYVENSYNYLEFEFNLLEASVVDGEANNAIVTVMFIPRVEITFVLTEEVPELTAIYTNPYSGATGEYIFDERYVECSENFTDVNIYESSGGAYYQDTMMIAKFTISIPLGCEFLFYNEDYDEIRWGVWKEGMPMQNFLHYIISLNDSLSLVAIYVDENNQDIGFIASIEDNNQFIITEIKAVEVYNKDGNKMETSPFDLTDINNENLIDGLFTFEDDMYMFIGWINVVSDNMKYYVSLDYFDENLKKANKFVAKFMKVTDIFIEE